MSKVLVENHREHDIVITVAVPGENQTITIPAGKTSDLANKFVPGSAEVDEELLAQGRKNKNVEAYFEAGYLTLPKASEAPAKSSKK